MNYTGGNYASGGLFNATDFLGNAGIGKSQMSLMSGVPGYAGGGSLPLGGSGPNLGIPQGGAATGGMPWGMLLQGLGSIAGQGGAPAPQTQNFSKPSGMIDPLYLIKQYAPQIAGRYAAAVPTLNTPMPRIGGLLG